MTNPSNWANQANTEVEQEPQPIGVGAFGNIYNQFKGKAKEAIRFLLGKKSGEAVGALHHKDIGDIDLVWGYEGTGKSDGFGLAKLAKYHPEVLDNIQEILDDMVVTNRTNNRVQLESNTHQASVRLTWDNEKKNWLLTAFEKKNSAIDNTTDTVETSNRGKQNDTATLQDTVPANKGSKKSNNTKLPVEKRRVTYFAKEDNELGEYFNFRDFVLRKIATGAIRFIWGDNKNGTKGLGSHLGLSKSNKERNKRIWLLDNTEGLYPEVAAEALLSQYAEEAFGQTEGLPEEITGITSIEAFNELMDVLHSYDTRNTMMQAAQELHNTGEEEYLANLEQKQETETINNQDTQGGLGNPLGEEREEVPFRQGDNTVQPKAKTKTKSKSTLSEQQLKEIKAEATRRMATLRKAAKEFSGKFDVFGLCEAVRADPLLAKLS